MEVKLLLTVFMLLVQVSLANWRRVTVRKGQTLHLSCPIINADKTTVEWRNPRQDIMFFNRNTVLKDKRYSINRLSDSEFTISISSVTFKDGGNYTCSHYDQHTTEKKVEVTVLGQPEMEVAKHEGKFVIKCTAEGNHYPPQISWQLDHGPEFMAHAQIHHEDRTYVSMGILYVQSVKKRVAVKCLVRHPNLVSPPLMNFVKIGRDSARLHSKATTSLPTTHPQASIGVMRTTTRWFKRGRTTKVYHTTRDVHGPTSESSIKLSAIPSNQLFSSSEPKTVTTPTRPAANPATSTGSGLSTTGWISMSETPDEIINSTERNRTGSSNETKLQKESERSSSLLVFLVTCLIFCLLVVVIFFAIKLRRAHILWKKENEDSNQSEDSSKSKSSQEERNTNGQRRRGLFKTAFTQYVAEEPTVITSNTGVTAATESVNKKQMSPTLPQSSSKCDIKETEL